MKKNRILKNFACVILLLGIVLLNTFSLSACGFNYYYEIGISEAIYDDGEQVVSVFFTNNNQSTTFKNTISTENIKFEGDLIGRTASKVEITSTGRLEITLGGKCSISSSASTKNRIIILGDATSDGRNYAYTVSRVLASGLITTSSTNSVNNNIGTFSSVFKVTSGANFEEDFITPQSIIVTNGAESLIEVSFDSEEKLVTITVENFVVTDSAQKPIVRFASDTTTLEKEITISVG